MGTDFTNSFWDTNQTYASFIAGGLTAGNLFDPSNISIFVNGSPVGAGNTIAGQGSFSTIVNGSNLDLVWTASVVSNPTLSVAPGTVAFTGLLRNAALPAGTGVTISNSGGTSSGSAVAITGAGAAKFSATAPAPANIPGGGSSTSTISLAAGATATNGTFTANVEYSAPSMTNLLSASTVVASVTVGNATADQSNSVTSFGGALNATVGAGPLYSAANVAAGTNQLSSTASGTTGVGGAPLLGTVATIVDGNVVGGNVSMAWRTRTTTEATNGRIPSCSAMWFVSRAWTPRPTSAGRTTLCCK